MKGKVISKKLIENNDKTQGLGQIYHVVSLDDIHEMLTNRVIDDTGISVCRTTGSYLPLGNDIEH